MKQHCMLFIDHGFCFMHGFKDFSIEQMQKMHETNKDMRLYLLCAAIWMLLFF